MTRDRDDYGRYEEKISDSQILEVLADAETPVLTAKELAKELGFTRQAARQRLNALYEDGHVGRMQVGARAVVWWVEDR